MPFDSPAQDLPSTQKPPFRLARYNTPPRTGRMRRVLKKLDITVHQYGIISGGQPLNKFAGQNPGWSQRAWEVLVLENVDALRSWPAAPPVAEALAEAL